jgi:hypothetical protein
MNEPFDRHGLPPELLPAVQEFDAWSQAQLLVEQNASTPTEPLYHYTDETALKGILTNEKLWCFEHKHQKDREEFNYSLGIARRVIAEVGESTDAPTRHFCACLLDLLDSNSITETFEFYLFSLSRHQDDPQQWREYGNKGRGYAIGFAPGLFEPTQNDLNEQANENVHVGRVLYGNAATEARHRSVIETAASITSKVAWANRSLPATVKPSDYLVAMTREVIASQLIWNCLTAKHEQFRNEREVRYIIMNVVAKFDAHRKFFKGKPHVETPLRLKAVGSIIEILVGPRAPSDAEAKISGFLKANGYPDSVAVRRSTVNPWPLRLHHPGEVLKRIGQQFAQTLVNRRKT